MQSTIIILITFFLLSACAANQAESSASQKTLKNILTSQETTFTLPRVKSNFPAYIDFIKNDMVHKGISRSIVNQAFAQVYFVDAAVKADRNQLEKKITLDQYLQRVLPESRVKQAQEKYHEYYSHLLPVTKKYHVPERYIVALWAVESNFGKIQGKEDIISSMTTLAFEGRREQFFMKELYSALKILQQGYITQDKLKGSWAGAMGQSQFMPSSYLKYAVDGNNDREIDIWNNVDDVFASIANYLTTEGWDPRVTWGREVKLPANFHKDWAGLEDNQARSVKSWRQLGITETNGQALPSSSQQAWVILPDDDLGRAFLVYSNFRTIMHWNRSYYFAITIGMLADRIDK